MICTSCNIDKEPVRFGFYPNKDIRKNVCKECDAVQRRQSYLAEVAEKKAAKEKNMRELLKEIIESCECRNSRRLKQCIEKAKVEVGGHYKHTAGGGY